MTSPDGSYRPKSDFHFGFAVKALLEQKGLSQRQFAKQADLEPDYVSKLVNGGIKEPRNATVEKIAQGLNCSVAELWQWVNEYAATGNCTVSDTQETDLGNDAPTDAGTNAAETAEPKPVFGAELLRTVPVWVGRDELVNRLEADFFLPEVGQGAKVLVLLGQGGIGKTSLAIKLLERIGVQLDQGSLAATSVYDAVICFKAEEGTSFDELVGWLLRALDIEVPEKAEPAQLIAAVIKGLQQGRYVLLLDNLEVVLHPAKQEQAGRAIELAWGQLLNALAHRPHCSRIMLTSRELPADLSDERSPTASPDPMLVQVETLSGISDKAGVTLLKQRQAKDNEADLEWMTQKVDGHVFVLTQLAALSSQKPGYLRQHPELVTQRAEPILQAQLERQSEAARELLKRMCVLRVGIDITGLTFLRLYEEPNKSDDLAQVPKLPPLPRFEDLVNGNELDEDLGGSNTDDWEDSHIEDLDDGNQERLVLPPLPKLPPLPSLSLLRKPSIELTATNIQETQELVDRLVESCLVQCRYDPQQQTDLYDLHRLIVEFLQAEYEAELPNLMQRVYAFYKSGKRVENPKTLEDLRPVLEAQHFAFQIGNYSEATNLLTGTLDDYLKSWGHWNLLKSLCHQILPYAKGTNY